MHRRHTAAYIQKHSSEAKKPHLKIKDLKIIL